MSEPAASGRVEWCRAGVSASIEDRDGNGRARPPCETLDANLCRIYKGIPVGQLLRFLGASQYGIPLRTTWAPGISTRRGHSAFCCGRTSALETGPDCNSYE